MLAGPQRVNVILSKCFSMLLRRDLKILVNIGKQYECIMMMKSTSLGMLKNVVLFSAYT